jgi:hypothetical protein
VFGFLQLSKFGTIQKKILIILNLRYMHEVLNIDKIKNKLHNLVVLYETNVLSLISQRLDNYYQIQTKYYSKFALPTLGTKQSQKPMRWW